MTNTISIVFLVLTNWQNIPGDLHRENGTNSVHQVQVVTTNAWIETVVMVTNRSVVIEIGSGTNGVHRWVPVAVAPGTPGGCEMAYYDYSKMTKADCLAEIDRLRREKPSKWRWAIKGICSHLASVEGIYARENPQVGNEHRGRPARDPRMLGGSPL